MYMTRRIKQKAFLRKGKVLKDRDEVSLVT